MSGFKSLKEKEKQQEDLLKSSEAPTPKKKKSSPVAQAKEAPLSTQSPSGGHDKTPISNWFAEDIAPITGEFGGIIGDDGTCKTAVVLNSVPEGQACVIIDFDGGGQAIRDSFYQHRRNDFKAVNPWVMQDMARTAYDYPKTHNKVMEKGREALAWAQAQLHPDYIGQRLHTVLITAVDLWDSVAMACMFIEDLGTAPDGIGSKISPHEKVGLRFNWQIRATRFHQLTSLCRELTRLGVNVFYETHWQYEQRADGTTTGAKKPRWEKQTSNYLYTIIEMEKTQIRDDDGFPTGETRYEANFSKAKTRADLLDQKRLVMSTFDDAPLKWYGLPELRGGTE